MIPSTLFLVQFLHLRAATIISPLPQKGMRQTAFLLRSKRATQASRLFQLKSRELQTVPEIQAPIHLAIVLETLQANKTLPDRSTKHHLALRRD